MDIYNHYNKNKNNNNNDNEQIYYDNQNTIKKNDVIPNNIKINSNTEDLYTEELEIKNKNDLKHLIFTQMKTSTPNFSRINISGIGIKLICSYLHKNPGGNYKEIKLLGCSLIDDDLFLLIKTLLEHNINLLMLNLSNNNISDESASCILDLVKNHQTLKGLSLYNNLISDLLKEKLKEYTELGRENLHSIQLYI